MRTDPRCKEPGLLKCFGCHYFGSCIVIRERCHARGAELCNGQFCGSCPVAGWKTAKASAVHERSEL